MLPNDKRPMSEGPEVRRTADKLSSLLIGRLIDKVIFRNAEFQELVQSLIGTHIERIETHGKNIVIQFSNCIYLRNHMMMGENGEFMTESNMMKAGRNRLQEEEKHT